MWVWGIYFLGQALPLAITSNFITFTKFWDEPGKNTVFDDIAKTLKIFNDFNDWPQKFKTTWRRDLVKLCTILPLVLLIIEVFLSKVKIPFRHIILNMGISLSYFLMTYIGQNLNQGNFPIYPNNLNWMCDYTPSYLVDPNPGP